MNISTLPLLFSFSSSWFLQGLQHPVLTPSHAILLCSLAFLIGQQGKLINHLVILLLAMIGGIFINHFLNPNVTLELLLLSLALIIGLLVAIRITTAPKLMLIISLILALFSGLLIGLDSQPISIPGLRNNSVINWHIGALSTAAISISIISATSMALHRFGDGIILRILGSWVATSALITLTLFYAKL